MSAATESPRMDLARAIEDRGEEITDGLILAALERAERQTGSSEVWLRVFVEHLGLEPTAPTSRRLRPDLGYLCHAGLLRRGEAKGREHWSLTAEGREELARSRDADVVRDLPESPQNRAWREARIRARAELSGFRRLAYAVVEEARETQSRPRTGDLRGVLRAGRATVVSRLAPRLGDLLRGGVAGAGGPHRRRRPRPGTRSRAAGRSGLGAIAVKAKGGEA